MHCYKTLIRSCCRFSFIFFVVLATLLCTSVKDVSAKDNFKKDLKQAQALSRVLEHTAGSILPSVVQVITNREYSPATEKYKPNLPGVKLAKQTGLGAGVIIDFSPSEKTAVILTTCSVIKDADNIMVKTADGRSFSSINVKGDEDTDVAIIRINGIDNAKVAEFGDSDELNIGQLILAVGNPFGFMGSVSMGIISAKERELNAAYRTLFIQTDVSVNPGSTGGPIVNLEGRVVGILSSIYGPDKGFDGIAFAVPINHARNIAKQLLQHGKVPRGRLGVMIQELAPEMRTKFNVPGTGGALVSDVVKDSAADKAGIQIGDTIIKFADKKINHLSDLLMAVDSSPLGVEHEIRLIRKGEEISMFVVLKEE